MIREVLAALAAANSLGVHHLVRRPQRRRSVEPGEPVASHGMHRTGWVGWVGEAGLRLVKDG